MLTIRKQQLTAFQDLFRKPFEEAMLLRLRKDFAVQTKSKSDAELRQLVNEAIRRAAQYKVVIEDDVSRFLDCVMAYGEDFDSKVRWARSALRASNITGTEKMDFIEKRRKEGA